MPESFHTSNKHGADVNTRSARWLVQVPNTSLDFIEAQIHEWSGEDRYERIAKGFEVVPIANLTADYIVTPSAIHVAENLSKRMYGNRIDVYRASDHKLIAYTQYYWDNAKWWECPKGISHPDFITNFIAEALNIPKKSNVAPQ